MSIPISEVKRFKALREEAIELECEIFGQDLEPGVPMCLSEGYGELAKIMGLLESKYKDLAK